MQPIPDDATNQRELLAGLAREFPAFEFETQSTWHGVSLVATARKRTAGNGIYAVVTQDPAELRVTLSGGGATAETNP
jgi:hypothetical protein